MTCESRHLWFLHGFHFLKRCGGGDDVLEQVFVNIIRGFFWKSQFFLWPAVGWSNLFALLEPSPAEEISTESVLSFSIESSFSTDWTAAHQQEFSHQSWCQGGEGKPCNICCKIFYWNLSSSAQSQTSQLWLQSQIVKKNNMKWSHRKIFHQLNKS